MGPDVDGAILFEVLDLALVGLVQPHANRHGEIARAYQANAVTSSAPCRVLTGSRAERM
jgi:hypothetical protein